MENQFLPDYRQLVHTNPDHQNFVVINWCIGNTCNYKCTYCPEDLHNGSLPWPELEVVKSFCDKVIRHYRGRKIYFEFTGGEVTLWKDLPQLTSYLKSQDIRVGIISNGSRSLKFWEGLIPDIDHVCLSFHPETGRTEHFFKIASLCHDKIRTHVNLMMHPDYFPECLALAYKVKNLSDVSMAIQPLMVDMNKDLFNYTEAQKKAIDTQNAFLSGQIKFSRRFEYYRGSMTMVTKNGEKKEMSPQRFISAGQNNWKGWKCAAGVEQIVVNMDGTVYRGWCQVGGSLGNISDEKLALPHQPVLCDKSHCHCNLDIMCTKTKPEPSFLDRVKTRFQPSQESSHA